MLFCVLEGGKVPLRDDEAYHFRYPHEAPGHPAGTAHLRCIEQHQARFAPDSRLRPLLAPCCQPDGACELQRRGRG
ncbi:MAG TPA: hypothetical protein VFE37_28760 [Chloroflexota bacterium]|nr:hypothetical protein [Chloroflexota bacterium]